MSYPHVRVAAAGDTEYFEVPRDYADAADWTARVATGWIRTAGRQPTRLHESHDRVHLVGGWTRYNARDEPIRWNRVTYILTRPAGSWGVQARFAVGAYDGRDDGVVAAAVAESAVGQVRRYYDALDGNDGKACAELCRFPMIEVGVGEVTRVEDGLQLARRVSGGRPRINDFTVTAAQSGARGAIVAVTAEYASGGGERSVLVVGREADSSRIAGISRMVTEA